MVSLKVSHDAGTHTNDANLDHATAGEMRIHSPEKTEKVTESANKGGKSTGINFDTMGFIERGTTFVRGLSTVFTETVIGKKVHPAGKLNLPTSCYGSKKSGRYSEETVPTGDRTDIDTTVGTELNADMAPASLGAMVIEDTDNPFHCFCHAPNGAGDTARQPQKSTL